MKFAFPIDEEERVQSLRQYRILDTAPEQQFDDLTRLASEICKTPIASINLVEGDRVWFKSRLGLDRNEMVRVFAFCAHAILQQDLFIVSTASKDERFSQNPFVLSEPHIEFYAGMPLVTPDGFAVGTLSVMDYRRRSLSGEQKQGLQALARQVMLLLDLRRSFAEVAKELDLEIIGCQHAQEANRIKELRLRSIVDLNLTGIVVVNITGAITEANDTFLKMLGYTRDDLTSGDLRWPAITSPERLLEETAFQRFQRPEACAPQEKEYLRKDGSRVPVLFRASPVQGSEQEFVCFVQDLTVDKQAQERVKFLAYHDALTDLPNQILFKDRLQQALALARLNDQMLAVMLINLDRFKVINDTLGYPTGDLVLQEVAQRLIRCIRESDTVARFGSDEFAILLTPIDRTEDAAQIAQKVKEALNLPFCFSDQELFITISIGISLHPDDGADGLTLMKGAGNALFRAKEQNANHYEFYTSGRTTKALKQLLLENNLRPGLEREEFVVHYQPQVNIDSAQLVGMEALVRWQHPVLGLLYPVDFIKLAEDSGLIVPIGEWVLRAACEQSNSWQDAGFDPLRIAVNLSARQFQQPNLVETIDQTLRDTGLNPHCLELELTESSIMKNPEQVIVKLHELKQMGVKISIDDFGTGYSSLSYLKRFPIDTLKVDQSFVRDISTDADDAAIVTAIITLAHTLKLKVIAEGVETAEQLEFLRVLKCDEVQGFLFSKALSVEEFTQLLEERRRFSSREDYSTAPLPRLSSGLLQVV